MSDVRNDAAKMMQDASQGRDISAQYNNMPPQEQRQAFTEMKSLQSNPGTMRQFGNVELVDSNNDGVMDDARSRMRDGSTKDVYNPSQSGEGQQAAGRPALSAREIALNPDLREADTILRQASRGGDVYNRVEQSRNPNLLEALKDVQASKPEFGNVRLIDSNKDGKLDDMRADVQDYKGQKPNVDVYKTPQDRQRERIQGGLEDAGKEIVDVAKRGGNVAKTTERKAKEVIGDIFKRH
jgi:hypothetical protein